ncbi:hypothetical protein BO71DRAFT_488787 [Aspergillus ellipticus CBS 707.79]|uniref:Uncharacterized protein n=1 Tax=Aspergillus ellipticus CBS 707.79 TaxID=1448320 RepID=A0A319CTA8_9EURO|nr:hypothetical protein BO71DRAFT_488787 [Aspergillus ellipticus CBS 707.79]
MPLEGFPCPRIAYWWCSVPKGSAGVAPGGTSSARVLDWPRSTVLLGVSTAKPSDTVSIEAETVRVVATAWATTLSLSAFNLGSLLAGPAKKLEHACGGYYGGNDVIVTIASENVARYAPSPWFGAILDVNTRGKHEQLATAYENADDRGFCTVEVLQRLHDSGGARTSSVPRNAQRLAVSHHAMQNLKDPHLVAMGQTHHATKITGVAQRMAAWRTEYTRATSWRWEARQIALQRAMCTII